MGFDWTIVFDGWIRFQWLCRNLLVVSCVWFLPMQQAMFPQGTDTSQQIKQQTNQIIDQQTIQAMNRSITPAPSNGSFSGFRCLVSSSENSNPEKISSSSIIPNTNINKNNSKNSNSNHHHHNNNDNSNKNRSKIKLQLQSLPSSSIQAAQALSFPQC